MADLKPLLSVLYALTCFIYHGSPAPQSSGLARVCWGAVNSTAPLLGLAVLMLLLLVASTLQLNQQSMLTVGSVIPLWTGVCVPLKSKRFREGSGEGRGWASQMSGALVCHQSFLASAQIEYV